jgi:small GTP-binding protein
LLKQQYYIQNKKQQKDSMDAKKLKFSFKITVVGDGAVGKTSLIKRYTKGSFSHDYIQTIGAQFCKYEEKINGDNCTLLFWDIAGQDTFNFLRPSFYKGSKAAIIVLSLEENDHGKESIKSIPSWYNDIKRFCGDIPVVLFGNKVDLVDEKSYENKKILKLMKKRTFLEYYKTSAKTGVGVFKAFQFIIKELYNNYSAI